MRPTLGRQDIHWAAVREAGVGAVGCKAQVNRDGGAVKTSLGAKYLLYPVPVLVVGTYSADGQANAATVAWGGIACSRPPCISISLRAATATHGNIMTRKAFTLGLPSDTSAVQADYLGLVSGRDHDKMAELGLTAVASDLVDAPYIAEFPLVP